MEFLKTVLVVGNGGREHAIVKALLRSDEPLCLFAYPGNPGMEDDGCTLVDSTVSSWDDLAVWADTNEIDLTVVGPEIPLVEGIVDIFKKRGLMVFGPDASASRIEGSKAFSKDLMKRYGIPSAAFETFSDHDAAVAYLEQQGAPIVVKASGLAAGKGAIVCDTMQDARDALRHMFAERAFGDAGTTVVLEEKLFGEEASVFVLSDGKSYRFLPVSQDHKAIGDGDTGPNTGGMGAYAPAPLVDAALLKEIETTIIVPTLEAMQKEGCPYKGLLYCGVIVTPSGPQVIEFNCRFGDPETQAVLPLVECNWYDVFHACATGKLNSVQWKIRDGACVSVVMASAGYPGSCGKGLEITGIADAEAKVANIDVYHAGTTRASDGRLVTSGGRVLSVSAWSDTLQGAIADAYVAVSKIKFEGANFRHDIAAKGVARLQKSGS